MDSATLIPEALLSRLSKLENDVVRMDAQSETRFAQISAKMDAGFAGLSAEVVKSGAKIVQIESNLVKWMAGFALAIIIAFITIGKFLVESKGSAYPPQTAPVIITIPNVPSVAAPASGMAEKPQPGPAPVQAPAPSNTEKP